MNGRAETDILRLRAGPGRRKRNGEQARQLARGAGTLVDAVFACESMQDNQVMLAQVLRCAQTNASPSPMLDWPTVTKQAWRRGARATGRSCGMGLGRVVRLSPSSGKAGEIARRTLRETRAEDAQSAEQGRLRGTDRCDGYNGTRVRRAHAR